MKKSENKLNKILIWMVVALFAINVGVMLFFTLTLNSKLNDALKLVEPQTGVLTVINPANCQQCQSMDKVSEYIRSQNVEYSESKMFMDESVEGKAIIAKYGIKKLPALIFESEEKISSALLKAIKADDKLFDENTIVYEMLLPPFYDLENGTIKGLTEITYLTDNSCAQCYNVVETQKPIVEKFGVVFRNQNMVDISTPKGKELISQYGITKVPTIILSSDLKEYEALSSIWEQVGTIEEDGSYVFRGINTLGVAYKDLETNKLLSPE